MEGFYYLYFFVWKEFIDWLDTSHTYSKTNNNILTFREILLKIVPD